MQLYSLLVWFSGLLVNQIRNYVTLVNQSNSLTVNMLCNSLTISHVLCPITIIRSSQALLLIYIDIMLLAHRTDTMIEGLC